LLRRVAGDPARAAFVRAGALSLMREGTNALVAAAASDPDGLVRAAAARALATLPQPQAAALGTPLLTDPLRAVRIEAARALLDAPAFNNSIAKPATAEGASAASRNGERASSGLEAAAAELIASDLASAERPEAHLNLSGIYRRLGRAVEARAALRTALRLDPRFVPALIALAELERFEHGDVLAQQLLVRAVEIDPSSAPAYYALGLSCARQGQLEQAREQLGHATRLQPMAADYAQAHALASLQLAQLAGPAHAQATER
jgi:tetratricopeptide (TPR) repeat protein